MSWLGHEMPNLSENAAAESRPVANVRSRPEVVVRRVPARSEAVPRVRHSGVPTQPVMRALAVAGLSLRAPDRRVNTVRGIVSPAVCNGSRLCENSACAAQRIFTLHFWSS